MNRHFITHTFSVTALLIAVYSFAFAQSPDKLIKEANSLFKSENYIDATPKYLQLLSLEPRNSFYNYRYGACLLFNSEKKPDALKYLKFAVTDSEVDPEAHYYLARAYHLNYYFDRAIKSYLTYKGLVKDKTAIKRDLERQIEMCKNGQKLMSKINEIIVKERKSTSYSDFFRLYNLKDIGGSIVVTEDFQSKIDKKKGHKPVIHIVDERNIIFYSSYGETDEEQKDIYYRLLKPNSQWGDPVKLPNTANTAFDEDYPYLDPNGKFLYFSSKGHNSMGGYDVFRIPVDLDEMTFGKIQNLDFAISSPDDDIFYVVDKDYKHAYFASARQSEGGKIHVYRVMVNKFESNMLLLAGDFVSTANPQAKNATIQIKEVSTGKIIDQVKSNPATGAISFSLPRGGKYEFIVQTDNSKTPQVIPYDAPIFEDSRLLKLNFLEESSGNSVKLRVTQDDYYQFAEDEKNDALANLFLNKSELQPNVQLQDLMDQGAQSNAPVASNEILKRLNIEKHPIADLAQISTQDLNRLKENFRKNEDQKKIFLQLAANNIEKAQNIEQQMNVLFDKAESGLTEREIKELKRLDQARTQHLASAVAANKIAANLQQQSNYIQGDITKADAVNQKMKSIKSQEDLKSLDSLTDSEKTFIKENFNRIKDQDAAQLIGVQNANTRLDQIDGSTQEYQNVRKKIDEAEAELSKQRQLLETAKKRDKPVIEEKMTQLEAELENLDRQERFLRKQNEKMTLEKDSLKAIQTLYAESRTINPNSVSASNSSRLIDAKLKTESSKKIDQKTQNTVENTKVIASNEIASNDPKLKKADEFHDKVQENASKIYALDKTIENTSNKDLSKKINLEKEKQELIKEQISTLNSLLTVIDNPKSVQQEIESHNVQLAVSENILAELEENYARVVAQNPNSSNNSVNNSSNNNSTDNNVNNTLSKAENEIADLKKSYNLETDINALDKNNDANKLRVQRYASALETMSTDQKWNSEEKAKIEYELKSANSWLDQSSAVASNLNNGNNNTSENNNTNSDVTIKTNNSQKNALQLVSSNNEKAQNHAEALLKAQSERDILAEELENAKNGFQERRIMRKIDKKDEEVQKQQFKMLIAEQEDYETVTKSTYESLSKKLSNEPTIKSEYIILKQKLDEVQDVVDVLKKTDRSDRERIMIQTLNLREDFLKQLNQLNNQIALQKEVEIASEKTGIQPSFFEDGKKLDYALANINEEITSTKDKINELESNLSSYSKSEQPRIQQDIEELKIHLEELTKLKKETQKRIQNRKTSVSIKKIELANKTTDEQLLSKMSDNDLIKAINDADFLSIRNDLVSFRLMDVKMTNALNKQKTLHNDMRALVNQIATEENQIRKTELRANFDELIEQYKNNEIDLQNLNAEMLRLSSKLEENKKYTTNPSLYNTLASSNKIQEVLMKAIAQQNASNSTGGQSNGITFVNNESRTNRIENFALNPVSIPGMIYKIQIGAFNRPIDMSVFGEFNPVTTDQVGNSIRYSAGLFYDKNQAFGSVGAIKALGYRDAFVVAYCDGVRYSVAEADELLRQGKCALNNAGQVAFESATPKNLNYNVAPNSAKAMPLEDAQGILFTVQLGVYNTPRTPALMQNLNPLNTQLTEKNQIRYSVGRFDKVQDAIAQREQAKELGFTDAFVVAYNNGQKISISEAQAIISAQGDLALFNNKQNTKLDLKDLRVEIQPIDSTETEQIEYLTAHSLQYRLVSTKSYTKAPTNIIDQYRSSNLWLYFDESQGKLVSSVVNSEVQNDPAFTVQTMYQGFKVNETENITYQNLEGYNSDETYYNLTMKWDDDLPALIAFMLIENYNFSIDSWNPENKTVTFAPLNYVQKEKIRKSLGIVGTVRFIESVVTF